MPKGNNFPIADTFSEAEQICSKAIFGEANKSKVMLPMSEFRERKEIACLQSGIHQQDEERFQQRINSNRSIHQKNNIIAAQKNNIIAAQNNISKSRSRSRGSRGSCGSSLRIRKPLKKPQMRIGSLN